MVIKNSPDLISGTEEVRDTRWPFFFCRQRSHGPLGSSVFRGSSQRSYCLDAVCAHFYIHSLLRKQPEFPYLPFMGGETEAWG